MTKKLPEESTARGLTYPWGMNWGPEEGEAHEVAEGVYWLRFPLPFSLEFINLYLLEDDDGWWIIDTGIAIGPTQKIWEQIFETALGDKPVKAVLSTHYHPDHTGMAGWLCEHWQVPFYMTQAEYLSGLAFSRMQSEHFSWNSANYLKQAGYSEPQIERDRGKADRHQPPPRRRSIASQIRPATLTPSKR